MRLDRERREWRMHSQKSESHERKRKGGRREHKYRTRRNKQLRGKEERGIRDKY